MSENPDAQQMAEDLRTLADALVRVSPDDPLVAQARVHTAAARDLLEGASPNPDGRRWADASVFVGALNVVAPPMSVRTGEQASGLPELLADVTLGARYEGPPGMVHGGIIAGMLDELLGATVSQLTPGRPGVTGRLILRYRKPTPLHTSTQLRAWVSEDRGRVVMAEATCSVDGVVAVEAKAMFVRAKAPRS